jgi:beta-glucanase (GH16 family)
MVLVQFSHLNLFLFNKKQIMIMLISNIKNIILIAALAANSCTDKKEVVVNTANQPVVDKNWQFETTPTWEDNFNGTSVDASKWSFETGGSGWGNNELQYYTPGTNVTLSNGVMSIVAKKEAFSGSQYTSTRMISKGKGDWLYGRFEVKAKIPKGRGTWPAIWMLPSDNAYGTWPASGEIDIMEHVGYDLNKIHSSVHTSSYNHTRGTQKTATKVLADATDSFHVYRVDWTPYAVKSYIDNTPYFEFKNENSGFAAWPFNKSFHLLLNVAVGGNWGGAQGIDDTAFPNSMAIDYVRVYKMIP